MPLLALHSTGCPVRPPDTCFLTPAVFGSLLLCFWVLRDFAFIFQLLISHLSWQCQQNTFYICFSVFKTLALLVQWPEMWHCFATPVAQRPGPLCSWQCPSHHTLGILRCFQPALLGPRHEAVFQLLCFHQKYLWRSLYLLFSSLKLLGTWWNLFFHLLTVLFRTMSS